MSEPTADKTATEKDAATTSQAAANALSGLMASGDKGGTKTAKPGPDLEGDALRAAEAALREGQKALAQARAHLGTPAPSRGKRSRELILRALLIFNVLAMIVVASLPAPQPKVEPTQPAAGEHATKPPTPVEPKFNEPWNRALVAAEKRDFAAAIAILDQYLADSPRMAPSQQLSVLMALSHYSARNNDFARSQEYQRRADAIEQSHALPDDLIAMAKAAAESGDQESLRRVWARFLLQQRQVPSWLYKHVAEAYLQLGDSYRVQANAAAEQARLQEMEETSKKLRAQITGQESHK